MSAADLIALVADPRSLEPWDETVVSTDPLGFRDRRPYTERLADATRCTGVSEAVLTGRIAVCGRPLAVIAGEAAFLGGSIGVATGERVARAFERALDGRLPVLAMTASGGTRMQEGTLALLQMAKLATAVGRLRSAGLMYVTYLTHPTTGGVLASWGSLGSLTLAAPGAFVGFTGPRVAELVTGRRLPAGVQTSERLYARGLVDELVAPARLRDRMSALLEVVVDGADPASAPPDDDRLAAPTGGAARASIGHARAAGRPAASSLLRAWASHVTAIRGDGAGGGDDPSCLVALARILGVPCVVIAQHRDEAAHGRSRMSPAGYRKARRGLALASELRLPLVSIVDTPGAEISAAAEEGGLSAEIARTLSDLLAVDVPTLAILLGEGGSGGALALLAADRVVCAQHGYLAPIAPEGASAILYRDVEHAGELAGQQGVASWDLLRAGIADVVVAERPAADREPDAFVARLGSAVAQELATLIATDAEERRAARGARYRRIGASAVANVP